MDIVTLEVTDSKKSGIDIVAFNMTVVGGAYCMSAMYVKGGKDQAGQSFFFSTDPTEPYSHVGDEGGLVGYFETVGGGRYGISHLTMCVIPCCCAPDAPDTDCNYDPKATPTATPVALPPDQCLGLGEDCMGFKYSCCSGLSCVKEQGQEKCLVK